MLEVPPATHTSPSHVRPGSQVASGRHGQPSVPGSHTIPVLLPVPVEEPLDDVLLLVVGSLVVVLVVTSVLDPESVLDVLIIGIVVVVIGRVSPVVVSSPPPAQARSAAAGALNQRREAMAEAWTSRPEASTSAPPPGAPPAGTKAPAPGSLRHEDSICLYKHVL